MRDDEKKFIVEILDRCYSAILKQEGCWPRDIINQENFYMHYKRAWYLLEKWSRKGWYEWGVTMDLGWITPEGIEEAKKVKASEKND